MDLEMANVSQSSIEGSFEASCSICLETLKNHRERSTADLQCGHRFHLDCIGSAFNAKGAMQCPNCRMVEKGRWLYANGNHTSADFDLDAWMTEDFHDLNYSELPFGFRLRGFARLLSVLERGGSQRNSYHDSLGNASYGENSSASGSSSHMCPYVALHRYNLAMHTSNPSSSTDVAPENITFSHHPTDLGRQPSADTLNSHGFSSSELQNHSWHQQHSIPFSLSGNTNDQSASQFGPRISRSDASSQQRLGSFVHPYPIVHASGPHSGSNLVSSLGPTAVGELRGHSHAHGHGSNHIYQQSLPSSSIQSAPFPPIRRSRPTGFALISSLAATSSAEVGGFYGFASVSTSANRSHQDAENMARRLHGWGSREGMTPLPWIPLDGEPQWWSPFNPNQAPQSRGSFLQQPNNAERANQSRQESGYQRMPLPPRMPPPSYM